MPGPDYGLPDDILVAVGGQGQGPNINYRAGDCSLAFSKGVTGELDARWVAPLSYAQLQSPTTLYAALPALGARVSLRDLVGSFWVGRVYSVELVLWLGSASLSVTAQGFGAGLGDKRFGNQTNPDTEGQIPPAVTFPKGMQTGEIMARAISLLGNNVFCDGSVNSMGQPLPETSRDFRGHSALDVINEYIYTTGASTWEVLGDAIGQPIFKLRTKAANGTVVGSMPLIGADEGIKLKWELNAVENACGVAWRDSNQHDLPQVEILNDATLQHAWPLGLGANLVRMKWVDGGNAVRSRSAAQSLAQQYLTNADGIVPVDGSASISWDRERLTLGGNDIPPWRIPANARLRVQNAPTCLGYLVSNDYLIVKVDWNTDEAKAVCSLGQFQSGARSFRMLMNEGNAKLGYAEPGVQNAVDLQSTIEKSSPGGYPALDLGSGASSWNEGRVPTDQTAVRVNHAGVPINLGNRQTVIPVANVARFFIWPYNCYIMKITVVSYPPTLIPGTPPTIRTRLRKCKINQWPAGLTEFVNTQYTSLIGALTVETPPDFLAVRMEQGELVALDVTENDAADNLLIQLDVTKDPDEAHRVVTAGQTRFLNDKET